MSELHVRWPPERFYWAVLDGSALPGASNLRGRRRLKQLGYLFENAIPGLAIEEIQAVYRPLRGPGRRYLACGVSQAQLREELDTETIVLAPEALPAFVHDCFDPLQLNVLTGAFLPPAVRRARGRLLLSVILLLAACSALLTVGLERRVRTAEAQAASILAAQTEVIEDILGPGSPKSGAQPAQLRLTAELRQLEQTRRDDPGASDILDCSAVLSHLLALWPADLNVRTESLVVAPESVNLRGIMSNMADAQRLADALLPLPGWRLQQPQSEAQRDAVTVALHFEPERKGQ